MISPTKKTAVSSKEFPEEVSEFKEAGLTPVPAMTVQHPRIAEAAACLATRGLVLGEIQPKTKRISETNYRPTGASSAIATPRRASASTCRARSPSEIRRFRDPRVAETALSEAAGS